MPREAKDKYTMFREKHPILSSNGFLFSTAAAIAIGAVVTAGAILLRYNQIYLQNQQRKFDEYMDCQMQQTRADREIYDLNLPQECLIRE